MDLSGELGEPTLESSPWDVTRLLALLAEQGHGAVLGVAPPGRAGIKRISAQSPDFERRFNQAFQNRYSALLRYALRRLADQGRAEDVVQQAFENVWRSHRANPKEILNLDAYMQTAVTHAINRELRNVIRFRGHESLDDDDAPHLPAASSDIENRVTNQSALESALALLPSRQREVLVLRYQCDLSVAETAEVLGISIGTVKSSAFEGLQRLRDRIAA